MANDVLILVLFVRGLWTYLVSFSEQMIRMSKDEDLLLKYLRIIYSENSNHVNISLDRHQMKIGNHTLNTIMKIMVAIHFRPPNFVFISFLGFNPIRHKIWMTNSIQPFVHDPVYYQQQENICSRFPGYSEPFASELLGDLEDVFLCY